MEPRNAQVPILAWALIGLQVLMGVSAVISGGMLVAAPDGSLMGMPASMLEHFPFSDFLIPGAILFAFLGVYPLAVAYGLWRRPRWGWAASLNPFEGTHWSWTGSLAAAAILVIWLTVEVVMIRAFEALHAIFYVYAAVLIVLSLGPSVRRHYGSRGS